MQWRASSKCPVAINIGYMDNSTPELVALYTLFVSIVIVCFVGVLLLIRKAHPPALPASALFLVALLSSTYAAAASGVLKHWEVLPPPPAIIMVLLVCLNCCLCFCTELGLHGGKRRIGLEAFGLAKLGVQENRVQRSRAQNHRGQHFRPALQSQCSNAKLVSSNA